MLRRFIIVSGVLLLLLTPVVRAEVVTPNSAGSLTQLQVLMAALTQLQAKLAILKTATPATTVAATATTSATTTAYDIIIVAGQSNSVGFGIGSYTEDLQLMTATNTAKVFQLGRFNDHNMKIIPVTHDPLEFWGQNETYGTTTNGKRGSSYPFALRLAATETTGRKVLVIPAAMGGTSILRWDKVINNFSSSTDPDTTILYDNMLTRVKFALAQNPQNRVVAVIWRQGEADVSALYTSTSPYHKFMSSTSTYQSKLIALRYRMRQDLSSQGCFPFLYGEMTKQWVPPVVKYQTMSGLVAKEAITNVIKYVASHDACAKSAFVLSDNTTANPGTIHFDAAGQWEMAKRFWNAYQTVTKK
jgi:hypothetical protein